jgi:predicted nucleic acid-binding Zn finger protein
VEAKRFMGLIERADKERLERALAGIFYGDYRVRGLEQKDDEVRAYVSNKDGKDYGVAINESEAFCHCPDYFFTNESICKHILMLSFTLLSKIRREEKLDAADRSSHSRYWLKAPIQKRPSKLLADIDREPHS